jgi:hypothetical protein
MLKKKSKKKTVAKRAKKPLTKTKKKAVRKSNRELLAERLKVRQSTPLSLPLPSPTATVVPAPTAVKALVETSKETLAEAKALEPAGQVEKVTKPDNNFPLWPDAKCGSCGFNASKDPNGDCFLYKLTCPTCEKVGCDECMPAGRGCNCLDCEQTAEAT